MKQQKSLFENVKKIEKINKMAKHLKKRRGKTQVTNIRNKVLVAQLCPTLCDPWTVARQAPLSMGFSRHEYHGGSPFPSPGDLPDPEIEPTSPALAGGFFTAEPPGTSTESGAFISILSLHSHHPP